MPSLQATSQKFKKKDFFLLFGLHYLNLRPVLQAWHFFPHFFAFLAKAAAATAAAAIADQFAPAHLSSCLFVRQYVVQGFDKLAVINTGGKCIVSSLYLTRPTQQYCGNTHESKVLVNCLGISQNLLCFGRSGASLRKVYFSSVTNENIDENSDRQTKQQIPKSSLAGT